MARLSILVLALLLAAGSATQGQQGGYGGGGGGGGRGYDGGPVFVNGVQIAPQQAQQLAIPGGRYWYDPWCGLWGYEGGPAMGLTQAGMQIGGQLRPDASAGQSGVSVNGRVLQPGEVAWLANFLGTQVPPGRYWLDAQGNMGQEGGPPLVNLAQVAQARGGGGGGGDNFWSSRSGFGNSSGGAGYVCTASGCATYGM